MDKKISLQVGGSYEFYFKNDHWPKWDKGVVTYLSKDHMIILFEDGEENHYSPDTFYRKGEFRYIKSEREILIDIITSMGNLSEGMLADAILAAGFTNNKDNK